jgi:hypothetical protein
MDNRIRVLSRGEYTEEWRVEHERGVHRGVEHEMLGRVVGERGWGACYCACSKILPVPPVSQPVLLVVQHCLHRLHRVLQAPTTDGRVVKPASSYAPSSAYSGRTAVVAVVIPQQVDSKRRVDERPTIPNHVCPTVCSRVVTRPPHDESVLTRLQAPFGL